MRMTASLVHKVRLIVRHSPGSGTGAFSWELLEEDPVEAVTPSVHLAFLLVLHALHRAPANLPIGNGKQLSLLLHVLPPIAAYIALLLHVLRDVPRLAVQTPPLPPPSCTLDLCHSPRGLGVQVNDFRFGRAGGIQRPVLLEPHDILADSLPPSNGELRIGLRMYWALWRVYG